MKKTILIMMVVLCLPLVTAIYGGDSYTKTFDECDNITVTIQSTRTIDSNEFILNDECTLVDNYIYNCNCTDNWVFNLTTKLNTINDYNISFNYDYTIEVSPPNNGGGSGGGSGRRRIIEIINKTICNSTNWNCSKWIELNGDKFRDCYNSCGTYILDKLSQPIVYTPKEIIKEVIPKEIVGVIEESDDNENVITTLIIVLSILGVLVLGGIIWFVIWWTKI